MMSDIAVDAPQKPTTVQVPMPAYEQIVIRRDQLRVKTGRPGLSLGEAVAWMCEQTRDLP